MKAPARGPTATACFSQKTVNSGALAVCVCDTFGNTVAEHGSSPDAICPAARLGHLVEEVHS
jgi:hypothetical protein